MMNETPRRSRRLVLKDHVGVADVNAFADARDWTVLGTVERDPEKGFFFEKKWAARAGVSMHYIVDEFLGERYMMAMSRHGNPDRELTRLSAGLDTWSLDEALFQFDASVYGADKERAVRLLAAISPASADQSIVERVIKASGSRYKGVRLAAVWAMAYADWPEYRETLASVAVRDTEEEIRRDAESILEDWKGRIPSLPAPPA
ncbi:MULTISPECIES: hypothetical protein [Actinomadura]|uniref:HEAT repeat domain-containing protein n=1 Tax=Actinomadura yumaensis TaxID=111807 RepID=A0ABW2CK78_9ACTN|nr:hypothetical protein [Actinomadura sp. J1-007]MWK38821.1 hypothetical protein [Actinomadura sp. J1-007]